MFTPSRLLLVVLLVCNPWVVGLPCRADEALARDYTVWKRTLVRRTLILRISPWPADIELARNLLWLIEWQERNGLERLLLDPDPTPASAEKAVVLMSRIVTRLRSTLFFLEMVPTERRQEWSVASVRRLLTDLERLERRQRWTCDALAAEAERRRTEAQKRMKTIEDAIFRVIGPSMNAQGEARR